MLLQAALTHWQSAVRESQDQAPIMTLSMTLPNLQTMTTRFASES